MEFAVQTPELLLAIFSNVEREHLTATARVCQKWSTLALGFIWRDLDSVVPLVELVVPLKCVDEFSGSWELSDLPTECSWNRYDAYADRVRTIQFDDASSLRDGRNQAITPELLRKVASLHPRGAFFPRQLRALKWLTEVPESAFAMMPFLCESLEEVVIDFDIDEETAKAVVEQAVMQTPRLKSLWFDLASPGRPLENSLAVWFSKSPLLESVALPRYYQTPAIVHALGNLTFLKHLNVNYTWWDEHVADYQYFCSTSVAFLALQKLEIDGPVGQLIQLFQARERFPQLNEAILSSVDLESPGQILKLTESISQRYPDITSVTLIFYRPNTDRNCNLSFQHIRPLLACRNLGVLEIGHNNPFCVSEKDLEEMGAAWLRIRELNLCSKPTRWNDNPVSGGVPLRLLPMMVALFPTVQILGIYVDSKDVPTFDHNIIPSVQFQALRVLDVGTSGVPACGPSTVGFFIGALCKSEVQILRGSAPRGGYRGGHSNAAEWDNVQDVIRLLVQSKKRIHEDWALVPRLGTTTF